MLLINIYILKKIISSNSYPKLYRIIKSKHRLRFNIRSGCQFDPASQRLGVGQSPPLFVATADSWVDFLIPTYQLHATWINWSKLPGPESASDALLLRWLRRVAGLHSTREPRNIVALARPDVLSSSPVVIAPGKTCYYLGTGRTLGSSWKALHRNTKPVILASLERLTCRAFGAVYCPPLGYCSEIPKLHDWSMGVATLRPRRHHSSQSGIGDQRLMANSALHGYPPLSKTVKNKLGPSGRTTLPVKMTSLRPSLNGISWTRTRLWPARTAVVGLFNMQ